MAPSYPDAVSFSAAAPVHFPYPPPTPAAISQPLSSDAPKAPPAGPKQLVFDLSDEKARQDLVNAVKAEKEDDEFRKDFPQLIEENKRLDETYTIIKSQYDAQVQEANKKLEELKLALMRKEGVVDAKIEEQKYVHNAIGKSLAMLKDVAHNRHMKKLEECKGTTMEPTEWQIKAMSFKYAVNPLSKEVVYDKLTADIN